MLTLHHAPNSRSGRIIWLLKELDIPFELNAMAFHPDDLKSDEHRARHPLGRIPVLDDGEVRIYESGAIVEYILARYANGKMRPSVDAVEFPAYLQWFHYCEGMVMPPINTIMVHTVILPAERRDETVLAQARRLLGRSLIPVDESLENKMYLAGDFSGADIMLGHACVMSSRLGQITPEMPRLQAYVDRLLARPALQEAMAL